MAAEHPQYHARQCVTGSALGERPVSGWIEPAVSIRKRDDGLVSF